ncbi:MAG: glutamate--tRNA ligase [Candidatus Berkelbacteria bacterium]
MIKTRFAPSPTGELHIGGSRTALFAYLIAASQAGDFFLRIEDTDRERFVEGSVERIISSLKWLGITAKNADKPMVQSERQEVYKKAAFDLVRVGKAYICTCSKEKLAEDRLAQEKTGRPPKYEGYCRNAELNIADLKEHCYTIRMKMPTSGKIIVNDLVRGNVEFDLSLFDDQVIFKSDGYPTYHLASVVDDHEMGITHVIRAEEWLSSTPKHLILYEMFGWAPPAFGHLSMILASDRTKLSKRHGATSVDEYRKLGYLPEAIINFIAFLGWNPKTDREIFSLSDLEKEFKIENLNKAPAIFNLDKLNSINSIYLQKQIAEIVAKNDNEQIRKYLHEFEAGDLSLGEIELLGRGGFNTLKEMADFILELREPPKYPAELLIFKKSDKEKTVKALQETITKFQSPENNQITNSSIQKMLESVVAENNLTNGDVFWPVRVALSGKERSPSPVELAIALGKEESAKRITAAFNILSK